MTTKLSKREQREQALKNNIKSNEMQEALAQAANTPVVRDANITWRGLELRLNALPPTVARDVLNFLGQYHYPKAVEPAR